MKEMNQQNFKNENRLLKQEQAYQTTTSDMSQNFYDGSVGEHTATASAPRNNNNLLKQHKLKMYNNKIEFDTNSRLVPTASSSIVQTSSTNSKNTFQLSYQTQQINTPIKVDDSAELNSNVRHYVIHHPKPVFTSFYHHDQDEVTSRQWSLQQQQQQEFLNSYMHKAPHTSKLSLQNFSFKTPNIDHDSHHLSSNFNSSQILNNSEMHYEESGHRSHNRVFNGRLNTTADQYLTLNDNSTHPLVNSRKQSSKSSLKCSDDDDDRRNQHKPSLNHGSHNNTDVENSSDMMNSYSEDDDLDEFEDGEDIYEDEDFEDTDDEREAMNRQQQQQQQHHHHHINPHDNQMNKSKIMKLSESQTNNKQMAYNDSNEYLMSDDSSHKQNRKRHRGELICQVCGANANGYNFDAITCESCKAFFRRNAFRPRNEFRCINNENCVITINTRKKCKKCRIDKCFKVGMRKEWIMSETEREEKRRKIEENRRKKAFKMQVQGQHTGSNEMLYASGINEKVSGNIHFKS